MVNFIFKTGDMFKTRTDAIVNPVNCVGVMGKGLALQFKLRWKSNFLHYVTACAVGRVRVGQMFIIKNELYNIDRGDVGYFKYLVNFPTKKHWRDSSKLEYIETGLDDLVKHIEKYDIKSISIPQIGCGLGNLEWSSVKPLIIDKLSVLDDTIDVLIYEDGKSLNTNQEVNF